jgi:hypothetical protein
VIFLEVSIRVHAERSGDGASTMGGSGFGSDVGVRDDDLDGVIDAAEG